MVPCFNEQNRLSVSYWKEILAFDAGINFVFIDDGSTDETFQILNELCRGSSSRVLRLENNVGKGNAIRQGFLQALENNQRLEFIGYLDSDGAFSMPDVLRLIEIAAKSKYLSPNNNYDAFISSRVSLAGRLIHRTPLRHYMGRIIATYLTRNWEGAPYDTQSGFKIFSISHSFNMAIASEFKTRWFVDIELLTRIGVVNSGHLSIWEEPLSYWKDVSGSKVTAVKFPEIVSEIIKARVQVLKLIGVRKRARGSN